MKALMEHVPWRVILCFTINWLGVCGSDTRMGYQLWVLWLLLSWVSSIGKVFKFGDCFAVRMIMCFGKMYNDDPIEFLYYWLHEHECYFANYLRLLVLSRLWILFPFISFLFDNAIYHENHMMMLNTTFIGNEKCILCFNCFSFTSSHAFKVLLCFYFFSFCIHPNC